MSFFKKAYEDIYAFRKIVISLVVICLLVGVAAFRFYSKVKQAAKEESEHYLREISNRIANNAERTINDNFAILETMKVVLENEGSTDATFSQIGNFINWQENNWDFTKVLLIDDAGVAYDFKGNEVSITGDSFLRTLSTEKDTIAPAQIINNEEMLIFASPLNGFSVDGNKMVALATCYDPDEFDKILSMTSFDEQSYSYIVDEQGKVVVQSSSKFGDQFGYNILHTILNEDDDADSSVKALMKDMKNDKKGQREFTIDNSDQYLVYTPIAMEEWYLFNFVPVSVVNAKTNMLLQNTLFMTGLVFLVFFLFLLIIISSFARHRKKLEQIAYVDDLTKGNTIQKFNEIVQEQMKVEKVRHALLYTNIQKFKVLNDQFGRKICDDIIISIQNGIASKLKEGEFIGHQSADNFNILIHYVDEEELNKRLKEWGRAIENIAFKKNASSPLYIMEYGIYILDDLSLPFSDMVDRTKLALSDNAIVHPENDYIRYSYYDEATRHRMIMDKHLEDMMDYALKENEFQMYLQPKYLISKDKVGGAEALVRWQSKEDGMIYPNDFIPLFEKNGFILKLDLWMFEQVCNLIQKWIKAGKEPIKISVNCSRVHLKNPNFLDAYKEVFSHYDIPPQYLELEFTENMMFEDTERLVKVIDEIHELGFECSMDDFGSGYSSLNLLQEIHVDTLKLDRIFFKNSLDNAPRRKAIISCVLEMAQSLKMTTVAEGIEIWDQVDMLKKLGCDYVQGYVYAKPMPIDEFENLLFSNSKKEKEDE